MTLEASIPPVSGPAAGPENSGVQVTVLARLAGMAYGCRQPSVICAITGSTSLNPDALRSLSTQVQPTGQSVDDDAPAPGRAALTIGAWSVALMQAASLPAFDPCRLLQVRVNPQGVHQAVIQVPCPPDLPGVAIEAVAWVARWLGQPLHADLGGLPASAHSLLARLRLRAVRGSEQMHILRAAHRAEIPWDRLVGNICLLGWGARGRVFENTMTDLEPATSVKIARQKALTAQALRRAGLPAPRHALAATEDEAVDLARRLGYPVVVKPSDLDGGVGVASRLVDEAQLRRAYERARRHSSSILVEKHFEGQDLRIGVLGGRVLWVTLRLPGAVTGNGVDTVETLLAQLNSDPRRGKGDAFALKTVPLDEEALELLTEQGLDRHSVPPSGTIVALRRTASISQGGIPIELYEGVHPDNLWLAEAAAKAVGLDFAGIDLLLTDYTRSWRDTGALICEVNASPQLSLTTTVDRFDAVVPGWVKAGGRIPSVVVVSAPGHWTVRSLQAALKARGRRVGLATPTETFIDDRLQGQASSLLASVQALQMSREVDALIVTVSDDSVIDTGLPLDRFDVLVQGTRFAGPLADRFDQVIGMLQPNSRHGVIAPGADERMARWDRVLGLLWPDEPPQPSPGGTM